MKILFDIMDKRRTLIATLGHSQGEDIPLERVNPIIPFLNKDGIICEVKRKSPSKKNIDTKLDPVQTAQKYINKGIKNISVLTEPNYFAGCLTDLVNIKNKFPEISILRKDFIIDKEDIAIAWRAGADAVLLIAAVHETPFLSELYNYAVGLGLSVLFEVHDRNDIEKARIIKPAILGINTRNLKTFITDLTVPLRLQTMINWPCRIVFESGIHSYQQAAFASASGATALLVGESVVKDSELIDKIRAGFSNPVQSRFWEKLYNRKSTRPLIKICGITNKNDLLYADELGADIVGLIFAESPRKISVTQAEQLPDTKALKAGVLVLNDATQIPAEIVELLKNDKLDILQIHGTISEQLIEEFPFPIYRAFSIKNENDIAKAGQTFYPRTLLDAFTSGMHGGTGKQIDAELVKQASKCMPLWLAGGLNPDNITNIINKFHPELVDASSGLESSPGKKSHKLLKTYFDNINACMEKKNELV